MAKRKSVHTQAPKPDEPKAQEHVKSVQTHKPDEPKAQEHAKEKGGANVRTHLLFSGLIVAIVAACYSNALGGAFCFDDYYAIVKNPDMFSQASFLQLWGKDFWGTPIGDEMSHKSYRPLCVTSFKLDRVIGEHLYGIEPYIPPESNGNDKNNTDDESDQKQHTPSVLSPFFHKVNVAYYAISCVLAYFFAVYVTQGDTLLSFVGTALFAVHPIHTEAVAGLVGRAEILCVIFSMISFFVYVRGMNIMRKGGAPAKGYMWILVSMILVCLGTLCKETGLTMTGVFAVYDLLYGLRNPPSKFSDLFDFKRFIDGGFLARITTILGTVAGFTAFRIHINHGFSNPTTRFVESPLKFLHGAKWLMNLGLNHAKYLQLMVYPHTMSCDYSDSCIPLIESLSDPRNLFSVIAYFSLLCVGVACAWTFSYNAIVFFVLMLCTAFPLSNLILSVGTMIGERLLFFPSLGFCLIVACVLLWLFRRPSKHLVPKVFACILFAAVFTGYALRTYKRNPDWDTPERLFESALKVCPHSAKVHYILGLQAQERREWDLSLVHFKLARKYGPPSYCDPDYGIGTSMFKGGDIKGGLNQLVKSLDCDYVRVPAFRGLRSFYSAAINEDPENRTLIYDWSLILAKINRTQDAINRLHSLVGYTWNNV